MKTTDKTDSKIDFKQLSEKWNRIWEERQVYHPDLASAKKPYYNLYMFPYPSAEGLHVGHAFSGTGADVHSRFQRMMGNDVFQPMGFDAFGIHSENFALKIGDHPRTLIERATKHFREQFESLGFSYDWAHSVNTSSPEYYQWTQWVFTTLFRAGLVVKKKSPVNWCPSCKTVLADEQVLSGKCERCGTQVESRDLEQWFFRITEYADKLLEGLDRIDWTPKVKLSQKNWIGKSEGLLFEAPVKDTDLKIQTFSAHFEAFYADTFVVIAPDHPFLDTLIEGVTNKDEIKDFARKLVEARKNEKPGEEKEPEGIFTGRYIVDPVGNGDLPIWIANYALRDYGTGIVKCSAHDLRDFAFAKKYGISLKPVLFPEDPELRKQVEDLEICYTDMVNGILSEPSDFAGKKAGKVRAEIVEYAEAKGLAQSVSKYHLRDWLISRQRYWGAPIPMVFCEKCFEAKKSYFDSPDSRVPVLSRPEDLMYGWFPVKDDELPVLLPYIEDFKPLGTGKSPLAMDEDFVNVKCPNCGEKARRETDVCDTFLDSSWYFLRYPSTDFDTVPFDKERTSKWLPSNIYIGGAEHSVLHLLYSRFVTKALFDLKLLSFDEPFPKFRAHGLIIKDGSKMSKSRGNVVNPDEYVAKYGADAIRLYLMFLGPFDQGGDFRDSGMEGMARFVRRIAKLVDYQTNASSDRFLTSENLTRVMSKTIKSVKSDLEKLSYNTAIARIMEYVNALAKEGGGKKLDPIYVKNLLLILAPFAPYLTEELFHKLEPNKVSIHLEGWPSFDEKNTVDEEITIAIQVNGKLRDTLSIDLNQSKNEEKIKELALASVKVVSYTEGKTIKKVIYVERKIVNIVI